MNMWNLAARVVKPASDVGIAITVFYAVAVAKR
jgi:hypothetical protein